MKTANSWRFAAWWLRRETEPRSSGCSVSGCQAQPTLAVAGDDSGTTFLCREHVVSWTESNLCRDYAQHNSGVTPAALRAWLNADGAEAA
jgi:hypothetical protein